MGRALIFLLPLWLITTGAEAIDLSATGGWNETVNAADLIAGAGTNLVDTYESSTSASSLTISNCTGDSDRWRLDVQRVDAGGWQGSFALYVKRTSDGTGTGSISDGLSYVEVTTTAIEFFSGFGDRSTVAVQYKLTGMSISITPDLYSTTITFTVVDVAP